MMNKLPKLILSDIDGVWTDGSMYYTEQGEAMKRFNTSDSAGVLFCKKLNIPVGIVTGENHQSVIKRAEKLSLDFVLVGISDKVKTIQKIIDELNIKWADIAYIGDDLNDIKVLKKVGFSATVPSARPYIKKHVQYITSLKGGEGAFRDFVEKILDDNNLLDVILKNFE